LVITSSLVAPFVTYQATSYQAASYQATSFLVATSLAACHAACQAASFLVTSSYLKIIIKVSNLKWNSDL